MVVESIQYHSIISSTTRILYCIGNILQFQRSPKVKTINYICIINMHKCILTNNNNNNIMVTFVFVKNITIYNKKFMCSGRKAYVMKL